MNHLPRTALAVLLVTVSAAALGATRYVTDELRISVRTGAGNQFRIIEVIGTGTRLETLKTEGEWARVRTPSGETGWVRNQYLAEQPVAADRLETVRSDLQDARDRVAELENQLEEARATSQSAQQRIATLENERDELQSRLSEAERGLSLHDENQRLKGEVDELEQRVTDLRTETERLAERRRREWFLIGAGVLLGGMLFGIVVTRIPWRRRKDRMF